MRHATPLSRALRGRAFAVLLAAGGAGLSLVAEPAGAQSPRGGASESALEEFKTRHEAVVALVKKKASTAKLQAEVDKLLDYTWIAQAALGGKGKYEQACAPRCDEFDKLLTRLIRENYLRLVRRAESHPIDYVGEIKGRKGAAKVTTRVKIEKNGRTQTVEVAYVMHQTADGWEVRDIITDGMSLAKTYRYEFNQIRKREGMDGIISKLETKLQELAQKD